MHENNNVECKCKEVGDALGLVDDQLQASNSGTLTIATGNLPFTLIKTDLNPITLIGGSCVLRVPPSLHSKCRSCPKIICAPVKQIPACQINSL